MFWHKFGHLYVSLRVYMLASQSILGVFSLANNLYSLSFSFHPVLIPALCKDTHSGQLSSEGLSPGPPSMVSTSPKYRDTFPVKTDSMQNCKPNYGIWIINNCHFSYGNASIVNFSSILSLLYHETPKIDEPKDQGWLVCGSIVEHRVVLDVFNQAFENISMDY